MESGSNTWKSVPSHNSEMSRQACDQPEIAHLFGGCAICHHQNTSHDHVCRHKQFEARHTLAYLQAMLQECGPAYASLWQVRLDILLAATPKRQQAIRDTIAENRALILQYADAGCTCPFDVVNCQCGSAARLLQLNQKHAYSV